LLPGVSFVVAVIKPKAAAAARAATAPIPTIPLVPTIAEICLCRPFVCQQRAALPVGGPLF
jgi:hypothetical protein